MTVPFSSAAAAYANVAGSGLRAPQPPGAAAADGPSFGALLRKAAEDSIETLRLGEQKSVEGVLGKADLTEVVTAVNAAEATLNAVVTIRDRVISAYQEMLRMPI